MRSLELSDIDLLFDETSTGPSVLLRKRRALDNGSTTAGTATTPVGLAMPIDTYQVIDRQTVKCLPSKIQELVFWF